MSHVLKLVQKKPDELRGKGRGERIMGRGEMVDLVRAHTWESTPLGAIQDWPETLVAVVNTALALPEPAAIFWGPELITIYNDAYREVLDWQHPGALGAPPAGLWASVWAKRLSQFHAVLDRGETVQEDCVTLQFHYRGREQETYWRLSMSPIYLDGRVAGMLNLCKETTESVLSMRALAESDARLRMAFSAGNGVGIWDLDFKTNLMYVDGEFSRYFKFPFEGDRPAAPLEEFFLSVHPDDEARVRYAVELSRTTSCDYSMQCRIIKPDGTTCWISSQARCFLDAEGVPARLTGVAVDLTGRKLFELRAGESPISLSREYGLSRVTDLLRTEESAGMPTAKITAAERVLGAVAVSFDDGKQALYSAPLLRAALHYAVDLSGIST